MYVPILMMWLFLFSLWLVYLFVKFHHFPISFAIGSLVNNQSAWTPANPKLLHWTWKSQPLTVLISLQREIICNSCKTSKSVTMRKRYISNLLLKLQTRQFKCYYKNAFNFKVVKYFFSILVISKIRIIFKN